MPTRAPRDLLAPTAPKIDAGRSDDAAEKTAAPRQVPMARTGMISPPLKPPARVSSVSAAFTMKAHQGRASPARAASICKRPVPQYERTSS